MTIRLLHENDYLAEMEHTVVPFLRAARQEGRLAGHDGEPVYYVLYRASDPRGTVVLLHGFTESAEKYDELAFYFLQSGLSVLLPEHRGHGRSVRTVKDVELVHIDRFEDYVDDLEVLLTQLDSQLVAPRYLFCHSMGGAVGGFYMMRHPDYFTRAVLSSPMIAPIRGPMPVWLARRICRKIIHKGRGEERFFAAKRPPAGDKGFLLSCATSRARYDFYTDKKKLLPEFGGNAPTWAWCYEALGVTEKLLSPEDAARVTLPVRLYAAQYETLVRRGPQRRFAALLPNCHMQVIKGARHEIFASTDAVLHPFVAELLAFFSESNN